MAKAKNIFQAGKMNKDADERLVQQGEYRDALNANVLTSAGSGMGAMENALSNSSLTVGTDTCMVRNITVTGNGGSYLFNGENLHDNAPYYLGVGNYTFNVDSGHPIKFYNGNADSYEVTSATTTNEINGDTFYSGTVVLKIKSDFDTISIDCQYHDTMTEPNAFVYKQICSTATVLDFGNNPVALGSVAEDSLNKIFWFVRSDDGSYIAEYDKDNNISSIVLKDSRVGNENVLNFSKSNYIESNVLYDNDNDRIILFFTDGVTQPKRIEVNDAKTWGENNFVLSDVTVIVKPPVYPPTLSLQTSTLAYENNLKEKFVYFAYRYKYKLGEFSPLSPFSQVAFDPYNFNFDYSIASNESMLNKINQANVTFNVGGDKVTDVQVIFKVAGDETLFIIDTYNKSKKGWTDDTDQSITFENNKIYGVLDPRELRRYYDNVPISAGTQNLVGNRIVYGNYTENFDLVNCNGEKVDLDFTASYTGTEVADADIGNAYSTVKTNRDYELGLVYLDEFGRSTTVLTSDNNTVYVPNSSSDEENRLTLSINHLPPKFASHFRVFVKQTKTDYHTILPSVFYNDSNTGQVYVLLNTSDIDKVNAGDFIIVKSDTGGKKTNLVETKILDVVKKEINFLENDQYPQSGDPAIAQVSGTYMVIKPVGFRMNISDYDIYESDDYDDSSNSLDNPLDGYGSANAAIDAESSNPNGTFNPFYYGTTSNQNDVVIDGTYTGSEYARLTISIDGTGDGVSTFDSISWTIDYLDDAATAGQSATGVAITAGSAQTLVDGITANFALATGHDTNDRWTINLKPSSPDYDGNKIAYPTIPGLPIDNQEIRTGTIINIEYDEYNEETQNWVYQFVADGNYANIEEWYHEASGVKAIFDTEFTESRIFFERGTYGEESTTITRSISDPLNMIIRSFGVQNSIADKRVKVNLKSRIVIRATSDELCFETKPVEDNASLYYEVPYTYDITSQGYHSGNTNQDNTTAASITVPFYNAWGWGNCVESYKIRDLFNSPKYKLENKPLSNISDYKRSYRTTSLTYSGTYEQSTKFNALNDFNLAELNYKDLDDKFGDINKIIPRDTDLIVFQENRVSRVLINKNVLYNADGSGSVTSTSDILGAVVAYSGEFGVTRHQFSVVLWGTRIYFVDERRGSVCRLSRDGIEEISDYGMNDWFRDRLKSESSKRILSGYDPHTRELIVTLQETLTEWRPDLVECELIYDDDAPPTSTTSTSSTTLEPTTSTTTEQPTTSTTTDFFF
jgi:hypothetical protein